MRRSSTAVCIPTLERGNEKGGLCWFTSPRFKAINLSLNAKQNSVKANQEKTVQTIELDALVDENHELHLKLPDRIKQGWARVIVHYEDTPAEVHMADTRKFGLFKGKGTVPDDFNDPLPDAFWTGDES